MTRQRPPDPYNNSICPPTYESASYFFRDAAEVKAHLHTASGRAGRYGRYSNPSWLTVESALTSTMRSEDSLLFASGMAAHTAAFLSHLQKGDQMIIPAESYRMVRRLSKELLPRLGVTVHELSIRDSDRFIHELASLAPKCRLVHLEMPSSPHQYLIDLEQARSVVPKSTLLTIDASFSPPPNFFPSDFGIDLSLYSATKYLGGHGDFVAGVASGRGDAIDKMRDFRDVTGAVASGAIAALLSRSLHTLEMRVDNVNRKASYLAEKLASHSRVRKVYYPGLQDHTHHHLAQRYLSGFGGVITFEIEGDEEQTSTLVDRLKVPYMASNFGAPQTLVEQSTFFTYFEYDDSELDDIGVSRSTIRLAVGFADPLSVIEEDLFEALES